MRPPTITDLHGLAEKLGLPKFVLTRYIFQSDRYYKQFSIRKRSGSGYRTICAPSRQMKGIQRWILAFILRTVDLPSACTAFREGCSIARNAEPHVRKAFVFNADIQDFFPSITTRRVIGLFRSLGYGKEVAFGLARLTTYRGRLPQGAPTSPEIANLICRRLDSRLLGLCARRNWDYTRHCDDMTISGDGGVDRESLKISTIVKDEGFRINARKTRAVRQHGRQLVTGLVVNDFVSVPRYLRGRWRAAFHQASLRPELFAHRASELKGYIGFLRMVRPHDPALLRYKEIAARLPAFPG
jgi:retron-type reverse transcriptase